MATPSFTSLDSNPRLTLLVLVDFDSPEAGLQVVQEDQHGHGDGQDEAGQQQSDDRLEIL